MIRLLALSALVSLAGCSQATDMCERCTCRGPIIDCRQKMHNHVNDTVWEGIINVEEVLLDLNGIVHLTALPAFGARKLSLRHNLISKVDDSAFRFVTNLTELDLGYNLLTSHSLTPHIFRGSYSPEKYQPLKDLTTLRLSGNILHSLRSDLFEHLPNLKNLYLDSNPFKTIDLSTSLAIASVYYLEVLDMSSMMLSGFPPSVFHTPKYLRVLNFSSNHFTEIPNALEETHALEEFIIDDNKISALRSFPRISTLKVLHMNWMPSLYSIESQALSNLTRLEELHCSHNRHLAHIAEDALMLSQDGLGEANTWPPLKKLFLRSNDLSYLGVSLVGRWDRVEEADLQQNPWTCDCQNQWLLTTLVPRINKSLKSELTCKEPPELLNVPLHELSERHTRMRCLDAFGNQPEKDGRILVSIFICVIILIPIAMAAIVILSYRMHRRSYTRDVPYKHIIKTDSI